LILPGGFSYGDYLRSGAIARFSPVLKAIKNFAKEGGLVIGICNGFQILLEAGLLPGAMLRNTTLKFICKNVHIRVENDETPFTTKFRNSDVIQMCVAHIEANYFVDERTLADLKENNQLILRYSNSLGEVGADNCPNGSLDNIAGICNIEKNVFGLMPHPERAMEDFLGASDGRKVFESIISYAGSGSRV
ncbi:MAG: phosphoribosylformylglycinamidine synthase subunit PurQ, partial [Actinobacteria bacterium]